MDLQSKFYRITERHGIALVTCLITLGCLAGSLLVASVAALPFNLPLIPTLYLAGVTPLLVAPPITYFLVRIVREIGRAQTRLAEGERQISNLYHRAPALLHSVDDQGRIINASDFWLERLGYKREEVIGHSYLDFLTEDSREYSRTVSFPAFLVAGSIKDVPLQLLTRSGEIVETTAAGVLETSAEGEPLRSTSILTEVTDLQRAQSALQQSEAKFRTVIERAGDAFLLHDEQGKFTEVNEAACRALGYDRAELLALNVSEVEVGISPDTLASYWDRLVLGEPITLTGSHRRKDGSEFPVEVRLGAMPVGDEFHVLALARDISDRLALEEERRQQEADLAHLLRNQTMSEMAGWLAHEINQPLAAIAAYVRGSMMRLKRGGANGDDILDALDKAHEQSLLAGEIVRRLRGYVTSSNDRGADTDIRRAVDEAVSMVAHLASSKNIQIAIDLPPETCVVRGDPVQFQQVIMNLLRNSIDAIDSQEDGPRHIRISAPSPSEDKIFITIEDSGSGIIDSVRDALFDRFVSSKPDGMGMGLAICRSIVEAMGGHIQIADTGDTGTRFLITLPVQAMAAEAHPAYAGASSFTP